jgi:hypothetical protein
LHSETEYGWQDNLRVSDPGTEARLPTPAVDATGAMQYQRAEGTAPVCVYRFRAKRTRRTNHSVDIRHNPPPRTQQAQFYLFFCFFFRDLNV